MAGINAGSLFNETYYLAQNPDVAAAVSAGVYASGRAHWDLYGQAEGRAFTAAFNSALYAELNPDLAEAGITTATALTLHFTQWGLEEGRLFLPTNVFNAAYYAEQNPDLGAAGITEPAQLMLHFVRNGLEENRVASELFDGNVYLAQNADVAAYLAAGNTFGGYTGVAAARLHYYSNGIEEGRAFPMKVQAFTLTESGTNVLEGASLTYTVEAAYTVSEDTTFTFTVTGDDLGGVVDKATAADFVAASGTVTIHAGSKTATFTITPTLDSTVEALEGFKVSLLNKALQVVGSKTAVVTDNSQNAPQTFTLDTGSNTFTGGLSNDTFTGTTANSLTNGDVLDGGAGTDTLNVILKGTTANATIKNIENITIQVDGATGDSTFDLTRTTGASKIINNVSTGRLDITNIGSTAITYEILSGGASGADGTDDNGTYLSFTTAALSGTADSVTITTNSSGTGTGNSAHDLGISSGTIENLNLVTTGSKSWIDLEAGSNVSKLTISGDAALNLDLSASAGVKTLDATSLTAALTVTAGTTAVTFTGGSAGDSITSGAGNNKLSGLGGNDTLTGGGANDTLLGGDGNDSLVAGAGNDSVDGGAGDDTIDFQGELATDTVVGGAGTDTIILTGSNSYNFSSATVSEVEVWSVRDAGGGLTVQTKAEPGLTSVIANESATDAQNVTISDLEAGVGVTLRQNTDAKGIATVSLALTDPTGTADSLTVTLEGVSGHESDNDVADLVITNIETLNLVSSSTTSTALIHGTDDSNTISDLSTDTNLKALHISGSSALTLTVGAEATKLALIDGSAATGAVKLTLSAGASPDATIKGGSAGDTITIGTAGTVSIDGGSGNDTIAMSAFLTAADTIDGGAGTGDTVTATINGLTTTTGQFNISNVETLTLTSATATSAVVLDKVTGLSRLNLVGDQKVTVTKLAAGVTVGTTTTTNTGTVDVALADATGTADALTFAVGNAAHNLQLVSAGVETVTISDGTADSATVDVTSVDATTLVLTGGDSTANLSLDTLNSKTTALSAAAYAGKIVAAGSDSATTFTVSGALAHTLDGGSANDTFVLGATSATLDLDGGAGTDSLSATLTSAVALTSIVNIENYTFTIGNGATVDFTDALIGATGASGLEDTDTKSVTFTGGNSLSKVKLDGTNLDTALTTLSFSGFNGAAEVTVAADIADSTLTITGAASTSDTLVTGYATAGSHAAKISGFETVTVGLDSNNTGGESHTLDLTTITAATVNLAASTSGITTGTVTNLANSGQKVNLGISTVAYGNSSVVNISTVSTSGTADSITVGLVNTDGGTVDFNTTGIETVNFEVANAAKSHALDIAGLASTGTTNSTVNVTGGQAGSSLTFTAIADTTTTIAASAFVGNLIISDRASVSMNIASGSGNDTLRMEVAGDVLSAGAGNDTLVVANTAILGGIQIDLSSTVDQVTSYNGSSNAAIQVGFENVNISGYLGGFGGDITGSSAANSITGSDGNDLINAGAGNDTIDAGAGNDSIDGGSGDDGIVGGAGNDTITGGDGADTITGGAGNDSLTGGSGADHFVFADTGANNGTDTFTDLTIGASNDVLDFSAFAIDGNGTATAPGTIGAVLTANPGATSDITGTIARLVEIGGGQDITTASGLTTALAGGGEYANIDMGNNGKAIIITSATNGNDADYIFFATSDGSGVISVTLVGVTTNNVDIDSYVVGNFLI